MASDYWNAFIEFASSIQDQTKSECAREYDLLTSIFKVYSRGFDALPQDGKGPTPIAQGAILSQSLNTFWAMIELSSKGFYVQSLIPLRHVYESWLSYWYLAKNPNEAARWLNPSPKMSPPKAETMRNQIDHPSKESKSKLKEYQDEMHRLAHIAPADVLSRLNQEDEKTIIGLGVRFERNGYRICAYAIAQWLGNFLATISTMIPDEHDWHTEYQESIDDILSFIDEYNAETGGVELPDEELDKDPS